jgi:mRNA interferase RelE/StbE
MYQVNFSKQSATVFKDFPQKRQLELVGEIGRLTPDLLQEGREPIGSFKRANTIYYRLRIDDLRFYFTVDGDNIHCIYIYNKNSWEDFRLRNNFEKLSDEEVERRPEFEKLFDK